MVANFSQESFAWGLEAVAGLHRIPFDAALVLSQFPPPHTVESFGEAAQGLGIRTGLRQVRAPELRQLPLPCLALMNVPAGEASDPAPSGDGERTVELALVLRCDADRVLVLAAGQGSPASVPLDEFARRYAGRAILFQREGQGEAVADPDAPIRREFGFRWFVPELLKHRKIWRDVLLASLAIQLMALATPVFTQIVIDKVIVHHTMNTLVVIGIALAIFVVFTAAMSWVRQYLVLHTGNRIDAVLATQVFEHLFRLPPRYFEHRPTGTLVARVQGVETIRSFITGAAATLILDAPFLLIFLAIMFYYSVTLTLITLALLAAIATLSFLITPLLRERINRQFLLGARNQAFLTEYVAGMETVKSLQMEPQLKNRFGDYLAAYLAANFNTRQLSNTYNVAANTLEQILTLAILCVGAWLVMTTQSLTIGMLVAFQMFASRLSGPLLRMVGLWQEFQQASIAVQRLGDVMNAPSEPYSLVPARESGGRGEIEIRGLGFRYAENLPWLYRDFDLKIPAGACVALMGPSGCGKSTLAKLLQGFYLPESGSISLDGRDIRHLAANELRRNFGVVPQETVLFSGSLYENLILANPHASFEDVMRACKLAEIHDVIEKLPQGYQSPIGEHGAGLSGGQKQRIAIARALLKRPRVLIFDEATSSLDAATAEHFARTVNQLKGKVTMLFIAHQLPRSLQLDEIVRIGGGVQVAAVAENK